MLGVLAIKGIASEGESPIGTQAVEFLNCPPCAAVISVGQLAPHRYNSIHRDNGAEMTGLRVIQAVLGDIRTNADSGWIKGGLRPTGAALRIRV
jgi:hypothetical protein